MKRLYAFWVLTLFIGQANAYDYSVGTHISNFAGDESGSLFVEAASDHWQFNLTYANASNSSLKTTNWDNYSVYSGTVGYQQVYTSLTAYLRTGVVYYTDLSSLSDDDSKIGLMTLVGLRARLLETSSGYASVGMEGGSMGKGFTTRDGNELGHGFVQQVYLMWTF